MSKTEVMIEINIHVARNIYIVSLPSGELQLTILAMAHHLIMILTGGSVRPFLGTCQQCIPKEQLVLTLSIFIQIISDFQVTKG